MNILVIDTLGVDRDILSALPYTTIEFDNPALTDAQKKADFFKKMMEGFFDEVSGLVPAHIALKIASDVGETDLPIDSSVIEELKARQDKLDRQNDEKHDLEMQQIKEQIAVAKNPPVSSPASGSKPAGNPDKKGHSYDNRLQQKQSEHVSSGGKQFQRIQKAQN